MRSIAEVFPNRLCGVLRTEDAHACFQAFLTAMEAGVHTIEITKTVPSCFDMIKGLIATTMGRYPVGVGTVWDPGAVKFFFSSRRRHTRFDCDWSSDVCSSD